MKTLDVQWSELNKIDLDDPYTNLLLNMMSGLKWEDMTEEEKQLMISHGYNPEQNKE